MFNPFSKVKIRSKVFYSKPKPKSETQVFLESEENEFCRVALKKYYNNPKFTTPLAILLNFQLGIRASELMALKFIDINGDYINIERAEIEDYIFDDKNGSIKVARNGVKVVDYTKSRAGKRGLYLNKTAKEIIKSIKYANMKFRYYDDYLFVGTKNKRLHWQSICACIEFQITKR